MNIGNGKYICEGCEQETENPQTFGAFHFCSLDCVYEFIDAVLFAIKSDAVFREIVLNKVLGVLK